jgi:hypothetical protein
LNCRTTTMEWLFFLLSDYWTIHNQIIELGQLPGYQLRILSWEL